MEERKFYSEVAIGYHYTNIHKVKDFKIMGRVPSKHFNTYVVTICFMEGDADGYQYKEVVIKDEEKLKEFVDFCFRCIVAYPHGKSGRDNYKHVEGYNRFVGDFDEDDWEEFIGDEPHTKSDTIYIRSWPDVDWEWYTSFDSFKVEYYCANGLPHIVEIITETQDAGNN